VKRARSLTVIAAICALLSCGRKRPFADEVTALQPANAAKTDGGAPAAAPVPAAIDCTTSPCDEPLLCDPDSRVCVECLAANDCAGSSSPVCDTAAHACVPCLVNADCAPPNSICRVNPSDSTTNSCVACTSDTDCRPEAPICDLNANECTARCANSGQCGPATPVCNEQSQICVQCLSNGDCAAPAVTCNTATARCVECLDDASCGAGKVCEVTSHTCVGCLDSSQCLDAFSAHCLTEPAAPGVLNTCGACIENRDCVNKPGVGRQCRVTDGVCVECITDAECSDDPSASTCSQIGDCIPCAVDFDCSLIAGRNACLQNQGCVECTNDASCAGNVRGPVCKVSNGGEAAGDAPTNTCVECTSKSDCPSPDASRCDNNQCVPCATDFDCANVDSTPNATGGTQLNVCDAGRCVECTVAQQQSCGANVCDSLSQQCSDRPISSADLCDSCVSDSECGMGSRCVEESGLGFFCIPLQTEGVCPLSGPARAFVTRAQVPTIDGQTSAVCRLRFATCPAFASYRAGTRCDDTTNDQPCGQGGSCEQDPFGQFFCTMPCLLDSECAQECDLATGSCAL
jgi:hypothetical protein